LGKFKIGIPRAFLYYKYQVMWRNFFENLGHEIITSPNTDKKIAERGIELSADESCFSAKIFLGHVDWLVNKADYILIPRIASYKNGDVSCAKFHALYDISRTIFPEVKFLNYNVDYKYKQSEWKAYIKMGLTLGAGFTHSLFSYKKAKLKLEEYEKDLEEKQDLKIKNNNKKLKILIVSHPYNIYDRFIGEPVIKKLKELNTEVLFSDIPDSKSMIEKSKELTSSLYWRCNKEIIGSIEHYKNNIDGIIFLTTFPCGPDSLTVELMLRKVNNIPMTSIIIDALQGETGLHTRIESFIDIILQKKGQEFCVI